MITRRASVTALAAVAVAGLASGCLSSGTSGGSSGEGTAAGAGKGTIEVMYGLGADTEPGFKADLQKWATSNGVTIKFTKAASWDTEIRARVAGGNAPDVGLFPQPGVMCDLAKQKKVLAWEDADVKADSADLVNGFVGAGTCAD